jgi:methylenetetrahydrofolate dehydrogenase (NADP+) / methenyltetrahydrofolate cyclohydrolase
MIIDGKAIADGIYKNWETSRPLTLGILAADSNPVIDSFVRIKEKAASRLGITMLRRALPVDGTTESAIAGVHSLADEADGIIVQLPLSSTIDISKVLAAIPPEKDVDGISLNPRVRPPVAAAVEEILMNELVPTRGKKAVVVGSGRLVGEPCARLLRERGADVQVIEKGDSLDALRDADIVVSGAGEPGIITPRHIKEGVILIDAGTSESAGKVAGDADPACAGVASVFTPVPGGVGPIAVAMIFRNLGELARHRM